MSFWLMLLAVCIPVYLAGVLIILGLLFTYYKTEKEASFIISKFLWEVLICLLSWFGLGILLYFYLDQKESDSKQQNEDLRVTRDKLRYIDKSLIKAEDRQQKILNLLSKENKK